MTSIEVIDVLNSLCNGQRTLITTKAKLIIVMQKNSSLFLLIWKVAQNNMIQSPKVQIQRGWEGKNNDKT
jgi:hypothetical protein